MSTPNSGGFDYWLGGRPLVSIQRPVGQFDYWLGGRPLSTLADTASVAITGTGGLTTSGATAAATGAETFTGTAALTNAGATAAAAGAETLTGTGGLTASHSAAATGSEVFTGTGALKTANATAAATATEAFTATGALATSSHTSAATGTNTPQAITGTGTLASAGSTLAATGTEKFTGTGNLTTSGATASATAAESFTGTGALTHAGSTSSGTGTEKFTGTAGLTQAGATMAGSGMTAAAITGSGGLGVSGASVGGRTFLTYYVSNTGSDSNNGLTTGAPFLTLAKLSATAFLQPGDTVALKRGDRWAETLTVRTVGNVGGTPGRPVTYTAYGTGADPVVSAADLVAWTFDSTDGAYDTYKKVSPGWAPNFMWRENGTLDAGEQVDSDFSMVQDTSLPTQYNHWWYNAGTSTLYAVVFAGEVPGIGFNFHVGRRNVCINEFADGQDYITLDHLKVRFQHEGSFYGQLHVAGNSVLNTNWTLSNIIFEWGGRGIAFGGLGTNSFADTRVLVLDHVIVRYQRSHGAQLIFLSAGSSCTDCDFIGNGKSGLGYAAKASSFTAGDVRLTRCRFNNNANAYNLWSSPLSVAGFDHGLYLVGQEPTMQRASGVVVEYCTADGNAKAGFATDALSSHQWFVRCVSTNNELFGFMLEGGTDNSSAYNTLYHCVAWGNLNSGLHVINCHGPFTAENCQFVGNGLTTNNQDFYIEWNIGEWHLHSGTNGVNAIYKHEHIDFDPVTLADETQHVITRVANLAAIVAADQWTYDAAAETVYVRHSGSTSMVGLTCWGNPAYTLDYNNYTPVAQLPSGNAIYRITKTGSTNTFYTTIAALRTGQSKEANGQQVDPLYVDTSLLDFHLQVGSPSRDVGLIITGINDGTGGSTIYQGAGPDIGAFEALPAFTGTGGLTAGSTVSGTATETLTGTGALANAGAHLAATATYAPPGISGTGALAGSGATVGATGAETLTATGALAASGSTIAATGTYTPQGITGTATLANAGASAGAIGAEVLTGLATLATASAGLVASGTYTPQGISGTGTLASGSTVAATGAEQFTATGALAASGTTLTASGTNTPQAITGTAGLTASGSLAASGAELLTGTGTLASAGAGMAATGTNTPQAISGTGSLTASGAITTAGTGTESFTGLAALATLGKAAATATNTPQAITGTATLATANPTLAASGVQTSVGSGTLAIAGAGLAGSGAMGPPPIFGTAALTHGGATVQAVAAEVFTGTGAVACTALHLEASAIESLIGTGALSATASTSGSGALVITGIGALASTGATTTATGATISQGTGALAVQATIAATGAVIQQGAGALALTGATVQGIGTTTATAITGTGALAATFGLAGGGGHPTTYRSTRIEFASLSSAHAEDDFLSFTTADAGEMSLV